MLLSDNDLAAIQTALDGGLEVDDPDPGGAADHRDCRQGAENVVPVAMVGPQVRSGTAISSTQWCVWSKGGGEAGVRERLPVSGFYNMDCMEYMRMLPDKAFDLAVVDPPYGINCADYSRGGLQPGRAKAPSTDYGRKGWDRAPPSEAYFRELERVSRNQIIWGSEPLYFPLSEG